MSDKSSFITNNNAVMCDFRAIFLHSYCYRASRWRGYADVSLCVLSPGAVTRENRHVLFCSGSGHRLESRSDHVAARWAHAKTRKAGRPDESVNV